MTRLVFALPLLILLAACGGDDGATAPSPYLLDADIADAVGVKDAMGAEPGTAVSVFGRVQEINRDGYAVFYIVDDTINYCGRGKKSCGCETPWDYCCEEDKMRVARMPVELRGDGGMPVKTDNLGIRLLDLVAVKGTIQKTDEGGLVLLADNGWYPRERPILPEGLRWPDQ